MYLYEYWVVFVNSFMAGAVGSWLGLVLLNLRPKLNKVGLVGLCYATLAVFLKSTSIDFHGTHFIILTLLLVPTIMIVWNLSLSTAAIASILGTLALAIGEAVFMPLFLKLLGLPIDVALRDPVISVLMALPQVAACLAIILLCLKFNLHIADLSRGGGETATPYTRARDMRITFLVIIFFGIILVQTWCNIIIFTINTSYHLSGLPTMIAGIISNVSILAAGLMVGLVIRQLISLIEKENQYKVQAEYISAMDELYTSIMAQRHDLVNHLQALSGFLQLGETAGAREYLEELLGEPLFTGHFTVPGQPGLSALLYLKSAAATSQEIRFLLSVESNWAHIAVPAYELNRVIGNLINNAFEHVLSLPEDMRVVRARIFEADDGYHFTIANPGHIGEDIKGKLLQKGFSTKKGPHSGLGLYIVRQLVEKYKGRLKVENVDDTVVFSVAFPMEVKAASEAFGQENSECFS